MDTQNYINNYKKFPFIPIMELNYDTIILNLIAMQCNYQIVNTPEINSFFNI